MKYVLRYILPLLFLLGFAPVIMAAPVSITCTTGTLTKNVDGSATGFSVVSLAWQSNASGTVTAPVVPMPDAFLQRATLATVAHGATTLYDVTLKDRDGYDVLLGVGANVSTETLQVTTLWSDKPVPTALPCALSITNAGASKTGTIRLYFCKPRD